MVPMSTTVAQPSVAPAEDEEYQSRLFSRDKHFAVDGEVMLLVFVLLFAFFLLFLICRLWLCRRSGDEEDVEFRSPDRSLGRNPNWVCSVRAQNKVIVNVKGVVLPKTCGTPDDQYCKQVFDNV